MSGRIFFSYSRADRAIVDPYVEAFRAQGLEPWIDRDEIEPGSDFIDRINEALRFPNAIIFHSASYAANTFTRREMSELTRAELTTGGRTLVLVRLDGTPPPPLLASKSWVWAGNPGDLAGVFSGNSPRDAHPAALAVGLSLPQPPAIEEFLRLLESRSVEMLALDCRDHLDRVGTPDRETSFAAAVDRFQLTFVAVAGPREMIVEDLRATLRRCDIHKIFINDFKEAIALQGINMNATAFKLALNNKLIDLDRERTELRDLLDGLLVGVA